MFAGVRGKLVIRWQADTHQLGAATRSRDLLQLWHRGQAVAAGSREEVEDLRNGAGATDIDMGLLRRPQRQQLRPGADCRTMCIQLGLLQLRRNLFVDLPQLAVLPGEHDDQCGQQQSDYGKQCTLEHRSSLNAALHRPYRNQQQDCQAFVSSVTQFPNHRTPP
ncbi:hypothetical protein D3C73_826060 [compost metagenome]